MFRKKETLCSVTRVEPRNDTFVPWHFLLRDGSFFMSIEKSFDSMNKTAKNKFENNR